MFTFRIGSIPVRVHGSFFLLTAILGSGVGKIDLLAQWMVIVFVGVLCHELGHALMARSFGLSPQIDLVGMGGVTTWRPKEGQPIGPGRRIAITLAGPFTGIAIGVMTFIAIVLRARGHAPPVDGPEATTTLDSLGGQIIFVNAGWGVLNLIPMLPLDGGNVLLQVLESVTKGRGERPARYVSIAVAVGAAILALITRWTYPALLAGLFALQNVQALRNGTARERDEPLRAVLKGGFEALDRGDPGAGVRAATDVLARAATPAMRADAIRLLAYGHLLSGAWGPLMEVLESPAASAIGEEEMGKFQQAAAELERPDEAARIATIRARRAKPAF